MERSQYYILDADHNPVPATLLDWARWFEDSTNRIVAKDYPRPKVMVSTVFLGIDHNFSTEGRPILFETMVLRGEEWGDEQRYCTWDEAVAGHAETVQRVEKEEE